MAAGKNAVKLSLRGDKKLKAATQRYSRRVSEQALQGDTLAQAAEPLRQRAAAKAPRRTGRLQRSIVTTTSPTGGGVVRSTTGRNQVRVGPSSDAFYGQFIELGTPHHAAEPYLRPAADSSRGLVIARFRAAIESTASSTRR